MKPGVYEIADKTYGNGHAFVTKKLIEIHFNQNPGNYIDDIDARVSKKIPDSGRGIIGCFYRGL